MLGMRCESTHVGQDFLILIVGIQLFRFRAGAQRSSFGTWRTRLFPAISRRRWTRAGWRDAKSPVCSTASGAR
jgi:hypothetical protein